MQLVKYQGAVVSQKILLAPLIISADIGGVIKAFMVALYRRRCIIQYADFLIQILDYKWVSVNMTAFFEHKSLPQQFGPINAAYKDIMADHKYCPSDLFVEFAMERDARIGIGKSCSCPVSFIWTTDWHRDEIYELFIYLKEQNMTIETAIDDGESIV